MGTESKERGLAGGSKTIPRQALSYKHLCHHLLLSVLAALGFFSTIWIWA